MKKVDERDMLFSRLGYQEGTEAYERYYEEHPDKKKVDDMLRSRPGFGAPRTETFDPVKTPVANAGFELLADMKHLAEGRPAAEKIPVEKNAMRREVKRQARYFGADLAGIAKTRPEHFYTHRGRPPEVWGIPVEEQPPHVIVFGVEMDEAMIRKAPGVEVAVEGVRSYVRTAVIGLWLAYWIRSLGYEARTHMDGNYLGMVQKMAVDAGLGEIGKSGLLLTRSFGSRIRLGAVTTNLPLTADRKDALGVARICEQCGRCVETCPSGAISGEARRKVDGRLEWPAISPERCYMVWSRMGTDCGLCISECPLSRKGAGSLLLERDSGDLLAEMLSELDESST